MENKIENCSIMIVDDTAENLKLLVDILKRKYNKIKALPSAKMALSSALKNPPDIILLDIMMPDMNGYEFCKKIKSDIRFVNTPIIFISALSTTIDKVKAFEVGAVDYITKPFQSEEVYARVKTHLQNKILQEELEIHNARLKSIVKEQVGEITNTHLAMIKAMVKLAEIRDDDTGKHIERTQIFCKTLAKELRNKEYKDSIDDDFIYNIYNASPLHDIGKVAISDAILLKPGKLNEEEFKIMKTHTALGEEYLINAYDGTKKNPFLEMGIEIAGSHHEKWDGTGYNRGTKGEEIPLSARIMAIADVYDALRSKRVYKEAFSHQLSVKIISEGRGKHFDPKVVDAFLRIEKQFEIIRDEMSD